MDVKQLHKLPVGTRDALHIPFVVVSYNNSNYLSPGDLVRFTDETCTKLEKTNFNQPLERYQAHGMVNPFVDKLTCDENVVVFLLPGLTSPVRHTFEINVKERNQIAIELEKELEQEKENDPNCAQCWYVLNDMVTRG